MDNYLEQVKLVLGISSNVRDPILINIIEGAIAELRNSGIDPENQTDYYKNEFHRYIIDYSAWLYESKGGRESMPRHLTFRRRNLQIGHHDI